jgi:regulator of sigma E protease
MGSLGGPISIFQASATAFSQGIAIYLNFLALISIMLAILNTIPIPGLDGGHLLIILIEKIIRRPVPVSVEFMIYRLGFIALILLLIHATINDLMRLF